MKRITMLSVVLLIAGLQLQAETQFQALTLDQALQRAGEEKKVVFVDFFTTWCIPCKQMDALVWKDEKVGAWLARNTVAIRLDAEKESAVAKRYQVAAYPSLLFIKPDGQAMDRIVGTCDVEGFLREAQGILSGEDPYVRAQRILKEAGENDPMARMKYARRLLGMNRPDEALQAYLWCYDTGMKSGPLKGVRDSFVINALGGLAQTLPAAREALAARLTEARARLENAAWAMTEVGETLQLLRALNAEVKERLALYDKLKSMPETDGNGRPEGMFSEELLEARRYGELARVIDPEKTAEGFLQEIKRQREWRKSNGEAQLLEMSGSISRAMIDNVCTQYQILWGCGEEAKAGGLLEQLLVLDGGAETLNGLAWSGLLTDRPGKVHLELAEKAWGLCEGKNADVLDTYCRLLARFGQRSRAEALIREFPKEKRDEKADRILKKCLDEIRRGAPPSR